MNNTLEADKIDSLLAKPAVIADRGFSERIALQLSQHSSTRRNLFLISGGCWFVLIILASSPQAALRAMLALAQSVDISSLFSTAASYSQLAAASPEQLPLATLAIVTLSLAGLASLALRG